MKTRAGLAGSSWRAAAVLPKKSRRPSFSQASQPSVAPLKRYLVKRALDPRAVHGAAPVRPGDQLVRAPAERDREIPALVVDPPLGRTLDRADFQAEADPEPAVAGVAVVGERELRREPQAAGRDLDRDAGDGGPGLLQGVDLGCRGGAQDVAEEAGRIGDLLGHAGRDRREEENPAECGADQSQARRASERRHRLTSLNGVPNTDRAAHVLSGPGCARSRRSGRARRSGSSRIPAGRRGRTGWGPGDGGERRPTVFAAQRPVPWRTAAAARPERPGRAATPARMRYSTQLRAAAAAARAARIRMRRHIGPPRMDGAARGDRPPPRRQGERKRVLRDFTAVYPN